MMPAICSPELKTYWSAVPRGQKPPPTVPEPEVSTPTSPRVERPKLTRFGPKLANDLANSLNPSLGALGHGLATAEPGTNPRVSAARVSPANSLRVPRSACIDSSRLSNRPGGGGGLNRHHHPAVVRSSLQA